MPDPIVERSRWLVAGPAAIAKVTRTEAERVADVASVRDDIETFLRQLRRNYPRLEGLVMYVLDGERVVGFAELLVELGEFQWTGPHLTKPA